MKKRGGDATSSASSSSSFSTNSDDDHRVEASSKRYKGSHRRRRGEGGYRREREEKRTKKKRKEREREKKRHSRSSRRSRRGQKRKVSDSDSSSGESESDFGYDSEPRLPPQQIVRGILKEFPDVSADLEQLLQMIDGGQAVDISELSERSLVKHLKKLFQSLNLEESGNHVFLLPTNVRPTLEVVMPIIRSQTQSEGYSLDTSKVLQDAPSVPPDVGCKDKVDDNVAVSCPREDSAGPKRRVIGPEMPSAELLAAAAKLTEAEAELREVELEEEAELFIGPPPPAMVKEAESANEAERFEEVTRIMGVEVDSPYDVLGVNRNMSADNIKKRYWKLSLMVHPDKCSHPQAHQAFIKLNKAFKDLQDPNKRKALDEQINLKEEQEKFKVELKAMREAAQWRHSQGLYMDGDDVLLADMGTEVAPKRDEWMTTLPPERKPGMTTHTTRFSRNSKGGRGDTSVWTDTPVERAQKAKMNYLEAYNEASALASKEQAKRSIDSVAQLVDDYNEAKRSKSLVEKHKEAAGAGSSSRKKSKQKQEQATKEEWEGQHPWKPWDREKDLTAGRKIVNFDSENLSQGLSSRFSSGSFQRNFL